VVDNEESDAALFPERVGDRLRAARLKAGLDLTDVASRTRVPLRQLQAIEAGDYSDIPSPTYCVGFVKAYARVVGEDEAALSRDLRVELGQTQSGGRAEAIDYEDADPARIPGKKLAWFGVGMIALVLAGFAIWRNYMITDTTPAPAAVEEIAPPTQNISPATTAPAVNPTGEVVLTAVNNVWLRVYDASDKVLFEKEMAAGERYAVPAGANNPMIRTGRADLINVTVGGKAVATLGPPERTVKDVGISAAALAARPPAPVATSTTPIPAAPNGAPQP
jgi:cytoskeleton protein RodZ